MHRCGSYKLFMWTMLYLPTLLRGCPAAWEGVILSGRLAWDAWDHTSNETKQKLSETTEYWDGRGTQPRAHLEQRPPRSLSSRAAVFLHCPDHPGKPPTPQRGGVFCGLVSWTSATVSLLAALISHWSSQLYVDCVVQWQNLLYVVCIDQGRGVKLHLTHSCYFKKRGH